MPLALRPRGCAAAASALLVFVATLAAVAGPVRAAGPIAQSIAPVPGMEARLSTVATGLAFPTDLAFPDPSGRAFVTTLGGQVRLVKNGALQPTPVLDLSATTTVGEERGMTSLAFHPDFATAASPHLGKFYVMTSEAANTATADMGTGSHHQNALYEYKLSAADPDVADLSSKRQVLRFNQPRGEHRVNDLTFGPDGLLYITSGDGGGTPAQSPNAQDLSLHHGKVLRIDVNGSNAANGQYGIPAANPFVATAGAAPEVFAYGFRNPYKLTFDRGNGDIWVGDVGQNNVEEVNKVAAAANYGWPHKEGSFAYNLVTRQVSTDLTGVPAGLTDPFGEYDHDEGNSVVGGFVYRGAMLPHLYGKYVFGDFLSDANNGHGRLFWMDTSSGDIHELSLSAGSIPLNFHLLGFAEDPSGELFLVGDNGQVMALVPEPSALAIAGVGLFAAMRRRRRRA